MLRGGLCLWVLKYGMDIEDGGRRPDRAARQVLSETEDRRGILRHFCAVPETRPRPFDAGRRIERRSRGILRRRRAVPKGRSFSLSSALRDRKMAAESNSIKSILL